MVHLCLGSVWIIYRWKLFICAILSLRRGSIVSVGDCFLQDNFPLGGSSPARTLFGSEGALRGWKDFDDYIFLEFQARFAVFINWLHRGGVSHDL
jgi:hypothetical protein